ncbi:hypothetical protein [Chelativorans sp. YIM 93263]|uniref:hypothetical protein n=1 Tax=Chelativorans sp. YIM 93263 TaxID=2906648 RepID=UPI0023789805|nr:hypothetical protein [Chelativorans sp. YIM 93263]
MLARLFALLATDEAAVVKRRLKAAVIAYALVGAAALLAFVFLILAGYLAAAIHWGAIESAIGFAVGFLLLALLVYVAYRILAGAQRRAQQRKRAADASMMAGASAMAMLPALLSKKGGVAAVLMGLAGIAGYAAYREFGRSGVDPSKRDE